MKLISLVFSVLISMSSNAMDIPDELRQTKSLQKIVKEFSDIFNVSCPVKMNLKQRAAHLRSLAVQIIKHPETNAADKLAFTFFANLNEQQLKNHYIRLLDPWHFDSQKAANSYLQEIVGLVFKPKL